MRFIICPVINVPGCPPIADVMTGVVTHLLVMGRSPELDSHGRPREFYGRRVHDTCYRRPYYDAGMFVRAWDDEHARKGYCLYKMGCRVPVTYNACSVTRWNQGTSYPIQSGHGCIGCSENGFWDNGPFYRHLASFPGFGIESTADTIGAAIGAAAVVNTPLLVLGIGNILMGDEGVGGEVVRQVEQRPLPGDVTCLDGGTGGFHLLGVLQQARRVILVDAQA